ncbi:IS110 family transposase [Patescibacteria group bacterium]|nr:IS110 family transposase [Patescibacteria group bacterium]
MSNANIYIGADLHKKTCYLTVMAKDGKIKKQTEISTDTDKVAEFFKKYKGANVAVESTMNWIPFYENVESIGCNVVLSNPLQTKAIAFARIKNDKVDSKILADLYRTNLLPTAYIQPRDIRDLKEIVRQRIGYVELRTRIKNKIHSVLFKNNIKHPFTNLYGKAGMIFLQKLALRNIYREELDQYLKTLEFLNEQIDEISDKIKSVAKEDYDCKLLMTIPGISYFSALTIKSEIGDIGRFPNGKKLCSYAGLIPSTYASAEKVRHGRITKRGSRWLRKTLVDAITSGSRNQNKISVFYQKLKKNKGTGKAKVAAARKLCEIIFAMLSDKQPFREFVPVKQR